MMTEMESNMRDRQNVTGFSPISGKVRRRRTVYSRTHLDLLLKTFETNPYPGISLREKLSNITGVHESRIQVWFQNRRARKNKKKFPQDEENLQQEEEWLQVNPVAQRVNPFAWSGKQFCKMGFQEKYDHMYQHCAAPTHPLNRSHMNSFDGPQNLNYNFPYQATSQMRPTDSSAQPFHHPYMVPGSHLYYSSINMERNYSECAPPSIKTLAPVHGASQESSLQDILEEFQPCWTEVATDITDIPDDLLCLF